MRNNEIKIYSSVKIDDGILNSILNIIKSKFNVSNITYELIVDANIVGGYMIKYDNYTIVLPYIQSSDMLVISSARELSEEEKKQYASYAQKHFSLSSDSHAQYLIDTDLVGGIRIRYKDKELDLSLDSILDKIFS